MGSKVGNIILICILHGPEGGGGGGWVNTSHTFRGDTNSSFSKTYLPIHAHTLYFGKEMWWFLKAYWIVNCMIYRRRRKFVYIMCLCEKVSLCCFWIILKGDGQDQFPNFVRRFDSPHFARGWCKASLTPPPHMPLNIVVQ